MAAAKKKQVRKYTFELTTAAIGGIGVVCFCIFLWMFLLGVWTGQTLLMPAFYEVVADAGDSQNIINLKDQKKNKPQ